MRLCVAIVATHPILLYAVLIAVLRFCVFFTAFTILLTQNIIAIDMANTKTGSIYSNPFVSICARSKIRITAR